MDSMVPCYSLLNMKVIYSLLNMKVIWSVHGFCYITMGGVGGGWLNMEICQNFVVTNFFLTFVVGQTSMDGVKNKWGKWGSNIYYYITTLSSFHFFRISQHPEKWIVSLGHVNASVVTCRYPKIYNVSFRKEFLETLCQCIYLVF